MPYVIMILGAIASLGYYFFIFRRAGEAVGSIVDSALTFRGKLRRNAFKKKVNQSPLTAVTDPGTAAAVLLVSVADAGDQPSEKVYSEIERIVFDQMGMTDAQEVVVFSRWVNEQLVNQLDIIRKLKPIWVEGLNPDELAQFCAMAEDIAAFDGVPNHEQKEIVRRLKEYLGLLN